MVPRWPLGLPGWDDSWAALALTNPQITLLTLFHRGSGPAEAAVPLPWLVDVPSEMEAVFPSELSDWTLEWDPTTAICSMCATRTVRRTLARWRCTPTH
jgi:alpha-galactosidase